MKVLKRHIHSLEKLSMKHLDLRHKIQIIFGLISLVPLALFGYILLAERTSLGASTWLLISLSILLALFGLELLYATIEEVSDKVKMNIRLIQSERLASVGRLAGGVAHEILNPINIISGRAQLLMMDQHLDSRVARTIEIINEQTKRVASVVNNLRQFSTRSKGGRTTLDIHEMLDRILNLLEYEMRINNIEIVRSFGPACPQVLGANDELGQSFLNIISDAIEAMPEGGVFTVSTAISRRDHRPVAEIRFTDTGQSIPAEVADALFDPFSTTNEKSLRSGVGLFVSYGIIRDHGGTIWADTSLGSGAAIVVELPLTTNPGATDETPEAVPCDVSGSASTDRTDHDGAGGR